jgi:hypothetical protein
VDENLNPLGIELAEAVHPAGVSKPMTESDVGAAAWPAATAAKVKTTESGAANLRTEVRRFIDWRPFEYSLTDSCATRRKILSPAEDFPAGLVLEHLYALKTWGGLGLP